MNLSKVVRVLARALGIEALYVKLLESEVKDGAVPRHVGVIMDGNRRWASRMGLSFVDGYRLGAEKAEEIVRWSVSYGIKVLTLYALSLDNLMKRPKEQLETIYGLMLDKLDKLEREGYISRHRIRVRAIGRVDLLPEELQERFKRLEERTKENDGFILNIAVAYSGREEIVEAIRRIAERVKRGEISPEKITHEVFLKELSTGDHVYPEPDLIIRTSGEMRLSDFLIYQSAYSELIFIDIMWPELRKIDFLRALRTYMNRKRNFGA